MRKKIGNVLVNVIKNGIRYKHSHPIWGILSSSDRYYTTGSNPKYFYIDFNIPSHEINYILSRDLASILIENITVCERYRKQFKSQPAYFKYSIPTHFDEAEGILNKLKKLTIVLEEVDRNNKKIDYTVKFEFTKDIKFMKDEYIMAML